MTSISTVGVITADRPSSARRSLESLLNHCELHHRRPRCLVIDGSKDPESRIATQLAVSSAARPRGLHGIYVGPKEAAEFLATLGVPDEVTPILAPGSSGANRNLFLLMTAGEHVLTIDDDVLCETWVGAGKRDGLDLMGHDQERFETAFFASRAAAFDAVGRTPADILAAHEALLGHGVTELMAASPYPVEVAHGCAHLRSSIENGDRLVVRATCAGLAGDAGVYCPYRLLFSSGPLRQLLLSSPSAFQTALTSREASRIVRTNVVTHDSGVMAPCMGVANRDVVPPFLPIGRNEDGAFGVMLSASDRNAVFGHVPVGVLHDSVRPSVRPVAEARSAAESRLADVVTPLVVHAQRRNPPTCESWLHEIGEQFIDFASLGWRDVAGFVTEMIREQRRLELEQIAGATSDGICPAHWHETLEVYRDRLSASLANPAFFLPIEFHGAGTTEDGYQALQRFLSQFGHLLVSWPALWRASRTLSYRGPRE